MGAFSIWHWLVVLAVVLLIFGPSKLPNLGHDLGKAIRDFKKAMQEQNSNAEKIDDDKKSS